MFRRLILTACLFIFTVSLAFAERVEITRINDDNDISIAVPESDEFRTVVNFEVGAFEKRPVEIDGETYYEIFAKDGSLHLQEGAPSLPRIRRNIIIPDKAEVQLNVISSEYTDYPDLPVAPSKGNLPRTILPEDVPYTFGSVYSSDEWFPEKLADIGRPFILRDFRGVSIEINTFQYNASTKTLRVYTNVTVEIVSTGESNINIIENRRPIGKRIPEFNLIYERRFLNYGIKAEAIRLSTAIEDYEAVSEVGELLIIAYDSFHDALLPLVDWKMQKGIRTTLVNLSDIGTTSADIKDYIETFYYNPDNNLAYVLLVGDAAQVPTDYTPGFVSDPSYVKLAGGDDYPDAFIGRFSAETTAEVETQVERTIQYENAYMADLWLRTGMGIASDLGPGHYGEYDDEHMDLIRQDLLGFTYTNVDRAYDPDVSQEYISGMLNGGRSIINYTGHGSTTGWSTGDFTSYHVNQLTNDYKLPFIISVACVNGNFANYTCFAETWLRATNGSYPTGAIAAYMSSINQSWNPPMDGQDECVDLLVAKAKTTIGGICFNGSCKTIELNGEDGVEVYDSWHLFGDPSLQVRTDVPVDPTVYYASVIPDDETEYRVEVVGEENALCALYLDGVLYGSAYTDEDGYAYIPITETLPLDEKLALTVSAFNYNPYIDSINVIAADGPFVFYQSYTINDYSGNGDGAADAGEPVSLGLNLENIGAGDAYGVEATLSSGDTYITITDDTELFGTISGGGGTSYVADAFAFSISTDAPDEYRASFHLVVTGSDRADTSWTGDFSILIHKPDLRFVAFEINEASGNNNGILDTGESVELTVFVSNYGTGMASDVSATLVESDICVSASDADGYFGDIAGDGGTGNNSGNTFTIDADGTCDQGYPATVRIDFSGQNGYAGTVHLVITVNDREPVYVDDFSTDKGWSGLGGDGEWTIGPAVGGGGQDVYGSPDPEFDHSPTEDNQVLGNDLTSEDGDYSAYIASAAWVESPSIDCSNYESVQLVFHRWLGIEEPAYDHVYIEAYNGAEWIQIFENTTTIEEIEWSEQVYDVSDEADLNSNFKIRFGIGPTDQGWQYCGWNIDDLVVKGYYIGGSGDPLIAFDPESFDAQLDIDEILMDTLNVINDGDGLLRVNFTGSEDWLTVPGDLYYIQPEESIELEFSINTTGMSDGEYSAAINFISNDRNGSIPVSLTVLQPFICGDIDEDESINILDVVYLINFLYKDGPEPAYPDSADVNSDEVLNILDVVHLINFLYKSGAEPDCP